MTNRDVESRKRGEEIWKATKAKMAWRRSEASSEDSFNGIKMRATPVINVHAMRHSMMPSR